MTRRRGRSRANSAFAPAAAMAGVVAGSIAGWSPVGRREEQSSTGFTEDQPRASLDQREGVEVHPDTRSDDSVIVRNPTSSNEPPSQNPDITPTLHKT